MALKISERLKIGVAFIMASVSSAFMSNAIIQLMPYDFGPYILFFISILTAIVIIPLLR